MPEITDSQYQEYMGLQSENKVLKQTAENTATGLKAGRDEIKTLKEEKTLLETTITEKETEITTKTEELATKDTELTESKELGQKWTDYETTNAEARTTNIEKLKTDLGDKFTDDHKSFIDGLDDAKVETYLNGLKPVETQAPDTTGGEQGNPAGTSDPSAFDTAASGGDVMGMLNAIPYDTK